MRPTEYFCECAQRSCATMVALSPPEYEHVRSAGDRFLVVPDHLVPDVEQVYREAQHLLDRRETRRGQLRRRRPRPQGLARVPSTSAVIWRLSGDIQPSLPQSCLLSAIPLVRFRPAKRPSFREMCLRRPRRARSGLLEACFQLRRTCTAAVLGRLWARPSAPARLAVVLHSIPAVNH